MSVVMPVLNARPYVDESIASVLAQTLGDFELVIRDDGSTDGSRELLRAWALRDPRIVLHEDERLGPVGSSNAVIELARAPIVARMDADDLAHPDRLRRQLEVLDRHADVDLVGTLSGAVDSRSRPIRPRDRGLLARSSSLAPFEHGTMMLRRSAFDRVGGYREACLYWEDLDLLLRIADGGRIVVLPAALYTFRYHGDGTRMASARDRVEVAMDQMFRCAAAHEECGEYDHLLRRDPRQRLLPRSIRGYAGLVLWTGRRPSLVRQLIRRGELRLDSDTASTLVWAAWARASPATLRRCLSALKRLRDGHAARRILDGQAYEWRPGREPLPLEDAGRGATMTGLERRAAA